MSKISWPLCFLIILFLATLPLFSATLELVSPLDYQVFQRHDRLRGSVRIEGKLDTIANVQFRFIGKPLEGKLYTDWQPLTVDRQKRCFCINSTLPSGGWYILEVQLVEGGKTLDRCVV
ncbi:MAG: hypothetical protein JXM70_08070, partial [Pirellulales bacterium]|nr:hypothetical protein [Pirellulales bacterium]